MLLRGSTNRVNMFDSSFAAFFGSVLSFASKKEMITFLALASNFALLDFERFDVIFDLFLMRLAERFIGWIIPKKVRVKCTRMVIFG